MVTEEQNEFAAPQALVTKNESAEPSAGKETTKFALFTQDWLQLQTCVTSALELPITKGNFEEKYGTFPDKTTVDNAVKAMRDLNTMGKRFGDPSTLKAEIAKNGDFLTSETPPEPIYGHIVWLATRISNTAGEIKSGLEFLDTKLDAAIPAETRLNTLKDLLIGEGGLVEAAKRMGDETKVLLEKLGTFSEDLVSAGKLMREYASEKLLASASQLKAEAETLMEKSQKAADDALSKYYWYMAGAITAGLVGILVGVAILVLSAGTMFLKAGAAMAVGAGAATGLGIAASKSKDNYNIYIEEVNKHKAEKKKKILLVNDLTDLNGKLTTVDAALVSFEGRLSGIMGAWVDVQSKLTWIGTNTTLEQMKVNATNQQRKVRAAHDKWEAVAKLTDEYTHSSLISFSHSVKFGQKLD